MKMKMYLDRHVTIIYDIRVTYVSWDGFSVKVTRRLVACYIRYNDDDSDVEDRDADGRTTTRLLRVYLPNEQVTLMLPLHDNCLCAFY